MQGYEFDELDFFSTIDKANIQALLIGRRALIALGLPLVTADYDFWINADHVEEFNRILLPFGLHPNLTPEQSRTRGRYVLENDERVDVLIARTVHTVQGQPILFSNVWERRELLQLAPDVHIATPCLEDLIATKWFGGRPKDLEDIRLLETLKETKV